MRIVARKLESGRIEFGLQQRQTDNTWSDRQLPRVRFFPTTAQVDRWLASSPLELTVGQVRIVARKIADGRVEFGLQQRQLDNTWVERRLPRVRFFPTSARVTRWLASSPLSLTDRPPQRAQETAQTSDGFSAVATGIFHSCGLHADGTVTCWGNNLEGQATAPDGHFTAITAGNDHTCGLRTNSTITCWGNNFYGEATAPDGHFTAITAGNDHTCGLRTNSTITCWGNNFYGEATAPDGHFTAITAGNDHTCGLRTDQHHHLLGCQLARRGHRARRALHRRHRRQRPDVRAAHRRYDRVLGPAALACRSMVSPLRRAQPRGALR